MMSTPKNATAFTADAVDLETETVAPARKYRVQLDFAARDYHQLNALVDELRLSTRAELFRNALVTLRWMVQKKQNGCTIVAVTPDDRLLEPEFEFLQGLERPQGAAASLHREISDTSEEVLTTL